MNARIVVDPDGSRWVSVDITEEQFAALSAADALGSVVRELDKAVRSYAERAADRAAAELADGLCRTCLECHEPLGDEECANERGEPSQVHADCWAAWCASEASIAEDRVDQCARCLAELTDETRHDVHDDLCLDCGERKEQRDYEAQEDRLVDAARENEMRREWGARS